MKKLLKTALWAAISSFMLLTTWACSDDLSSDNNYISIDPAESYMWSYLRFESENGTNLLDYFSDLMPSEEYGGFDQDSIPWLNIECTRGSDQAKMTLSSTLWYHVREESILRPLLGDGPILMVAWLDMDALYGPSDTRQKEDTYTLRIVSNRLFSQGEAEVKWSVKFQHNNRLYDFWRCEVDGQESEFKYIGGNGPADAVFTRVVCSQNE